MAFKHGALLEANPAISCKCALKITYETLGQGGKIPYWPWHIRFRLRFVESHEALQGLVCLLAGNNHHEAVGLQVVLKPKNAALPLMAAPMYCMSA